MTVMTIKFVNAAADGKTFGSIVDNGGTRYPCPAALIQHFTKGQSYDVPLKQETWKSGPVTVIGGPPAQQQQAAPPAGHNSARMTPQPNKDVLITSTALMKSFIETGNFGLTDLDALMKACVPAARLMVRAASGEPAQ